MKELLSKQQYSCTYMFFFNHLTQEEISKMLNLDYTTVSKYIFNSIDKIKKSEYFLKFLEKIM
jgi:DNA-directed RNA polymerase specialized sigma subunit